MDVLERRKRLQDEKIRLRYGASVEELEAAVAQVIVPNLALPVPLKATPCRGRIKMSTMKAFVCLLALVCYEFVRIFLTIIWCLQTQLIDEAFQQHGCENFIDKLYAALQQGHLKTTWINGQFMAAIVNNCSKEFSDAWSFSEVIYKFALVIQSQFGPDCIDFLRGGSGRLKRARANIPLPSNEEINHYAKSSLSQVIVPGLALPVTLEAATCSQRMRKFMMKALICLLVLVCYESLGHFLTTFWCLQVQVHVNNGCNDFVKKLYTGLQQGHLKPSWINGQLLAAIVNNCSKEFSDEWTFSEVMYNFALMIQFEFGPGCIETSCEGAAAA